jgi:quercetin dioxygenase-like cupin family protein
MRKAQLQDMVKGWFVGNFAPTALASDACEVAVKVYAAGDAEAWHYHKVATEVTLILSGEVEMNGVRHATGDIVVLDPGEGTDFRCLTAVTTVVVKLPCVAGDKYTDRPEGA